jgi:predicted ATPase
MLKIASCIGVTIYECLLAETAHPAPAVGPGLRAAKDHGLITFDFESGSGSFMHGRIQEAAYSLIPECDRASMHLDIGRRLWIWLSPHDQEAHLFTICNQIIRGKHLLDDKTENTELAALMLRAGRKAARMSSFKTAASYFDVGMSLLDRKHWQRQYQLSFDLYNAAAKVEYYNGNLDRVDALLDEIFENAKSEDDKLRAHFAQIYSLGSRDDMKQALTKGLDVLQSLGDPLPHKPWKLQVSHAFSRCRRRLCNMSDDQIMNLPRMEDSKQLVAMRLLNTIFISAFSSGEDLVTLIVTRMIENTLRQGLSAMSKLSMTIYNLVARVSNC